jgi:hypothetical protein
MLLIVVCLLASGHLPAGEIGTCGHGRVELEASTATATDLRLACEAVSHGVGFLRARGVEADATLRIRVVDELPSQHGIASLGQFDPTHSEIRVLSLTDFRAAYRKTGTDHGSFAPANALRKLQFPDESGHVVFVLCPLLRCLVRAASSLFVRVVAVSKPSLKRSANGMPSLALSLRVRLELFSVCWIPDQLRTDGGGQDRDH